MPSFSTCFRRWSRVPQTPIACQGQTHHISGHRCEQAEMPRRHVRDSLKASQSLFLCPGRQSQRGQWRDSKGPSQSRSPRRRLQLGLKGWRVKEWPRCPGLSQPGALTTPEMPEAHLGPRPMHPPQSSPLPETPPTVRGAAAPPSGSAGNDIFPRALGDIRPAHPRVGPCDISRPTDLLSQMQSKAQRRDDTCSAW